MALHCGRFHHKSEKKVGSSGTAGGELHFHYTHSLHQSLHFRCDLCAVLTRQSQEPRWQWIR